MVRQAIFFVIFFIVFSHASPAGSTLSPYRLSFKECVEMALGNNYQIQAAYYDREMAEAKRREASPRGIPVVKYEHKIAPVPRDVDNMAESFFSGDISVFNNFEMEFGTPLTTFGKIKTAQALADIGINASWFQKDKTENEIVFKIYQIYQGIILARELLDLADKAKDTLHGKIEEMQKEKVVDQIAILKLKLVLFEVERKVEEAKKKKALAFAALKVQLGLENDVPLDIKGEGLAAFSYHLLPLNDYLELAKSHRPEYQLLNSGIRAKEKKIKLEELNYVPNLGVGGFVDVGRAPGIRGAEDENNFSNPFNFTKAGIGIQLKGELDYVKTSSRLRQAEADYLKSLYEKRAAQKGLELEIQQSYYEILSARSLMQKAGEEKKAARQMVFLTKSNVDIGLGDKKDYYETLQSYLIFQGREYEAIYNYNVAIHDLKKKVGILSEELKGGE